MAAQQYIVGIWIAFILVCNCGWEQAHPSDIQLNYMCDPCLSLLSLALINHQL